MGIRCADHVTPLYPEKLALTSPTGGGRSVGIVRLRTKATEFSLVVQGHFPVGHLLQLGDGQIGCCCDELRGSYPQSTILVVGSSCWLIYVLICKVNLGAITGLRLGRCPETRRCGISCTALCE